MSVGKCVSSEAETFSQRKTQDALCTVELGVCETVLGLRVTTFYKCGSLPAIWKFVEMEEFSGDSWERPGAKVSHQIGASASLGHEEKAPSEQCSRKSSMT